MLAAVAGVFYLLLLGINPFIGLPLTLRYLYQHHPGRARQPVWLSGRGCDSGIDRGFYGLPAEPTGRRRVALMLVVVLLVRTQGCSGTQP